jgi:hypothetical protein
LSGRHANNLIEADHGWLKARLGTMRGLKRYRSARILAAGHAFVQNLRRGHYEIATETRALTGSASPSTTPPGTDCGSWGAPNRLHQQVHHHRHQYQRRGHLLASIDWEAAVTAPTRSSPSRPSPAPPDNQPRDHPSWRRPHGRQQTLRCPDRRTHRIRLRHLIKGGSDGSQD